MCVWNIASDNSSLSDETIMKLIYYNNSVTSFMNSTSSKGITGCKGMGKNFFIKGKANKNAK